jgi:hypothetical protein
MIKFQETPDRIFIEILKTGMEIITDEIEDILGYSESPKRAKDELRLVLPLAAKVFSPEAALRTLRDMLEKLFLPGLYQMNDYHFLLLYDTLQLYSELHNDMVRTAGSKEERIAAAAIGPYYILKTDFGRIIDIYFCNTNFLFDPDVMLSLREEEKKYMEINPEAFSVAQGLPPHPEELVLRELPGEVYKIPETSSYFNDSSAVYPDDI